MFPASFEIELKISLADDGSISKTVMEKKEGSPYTVV